MVEAGWSGPGVCTLWFQFFGAVFASKEYPKEHNSQRFNFGAISIIFTDVLYSHTGIF